MERDLYKFYDNVEILNKDFSIYEDEKGNYFTFNTINGLLRVDKLELTKEEYQVARFQQKVDELEKIYQEKITLEFYNNKCTELFNMDLPTLMQDIGLATEEEGSKFANDFLTYLSGNIPR